MKARLLNFDVVEMAEGEDGKRKKRRKRMDVEMEYVPPAEGVSKPYMAYFSTGFNPRKEEREEHVQVEIYENEQPRKQFQQQMVVRTGSAVDFVGSTYSGEAAAWQSCGYALGVFDKDVGTLKVLPVVGDKVLRLEPRVRGTAYHMSEVKETNEDELTPDMRSQKTRLLLSRFGTKKSQRMFDKRGKSILKDSALADSGDVKEFLQDAVQKADIQTQDEIMEQVNAALTRNLPPFDTKATTPDGAYPVEKIIPSEEWDTLDISELLEAAKDPNLCAGLRESGVYPGFVVNRLQRLTVQGDQDGNIRRANILLYIKHLLKFYHASKQEVGSAADPLRPSGFKSIDLCKKFKIPPVVMSKFLNLFTTSIKEKGNREWRHRTNEHISRLICYIIVLGLKIDDFNTDPYDMAVELKMEMKEIKLHYEQIGGKFKTVNASRAEKNEMGAKGKFRVTLPVPLQFAVLRMRKGKRK